MDSDRDHLTIAGIALFIAGLVWTARYTMRDLASPHTYDGALLIGGAVTGIGVILAAIGVLTRLRSR
ncbi:MAG: hypothetical protein ACJ786_22655 [Catenulispora sp.]